MVCVPVNVAVCELQAMRPREVREPCLLLQASNISALVNPLISSPSTSPLNPISFPLPFEPPLPAGTLDSLPLILRLARREVDAVEGVGPDE